MQEIKTWMSASLSCGAMMRRLMVLAVVDEVRREMADGAQGKGRLTLKK